jgi:hypothetical protein
MDTFWKQFEADDISKIEENFSPIVKDYFKEFNNSLKLENINTPLIEKLEQISGDDYSEIKEMLVSPQMLLIFKGLTLSPSSDSGIDDQMITNISQVLPLLIDWVKSKRENDNIENIYNLICAVVISNMISCQISIGESMQNIDNSLQKLQQLMNTNA